MAIEGGAAKPVYVTNSPPFLGGSAEPVVLMASDGVTPLSVVSAAQIQSLVVVPEGRSRGSGVTQLSLPGVKTSAYGTVAIAANLVRYMPILVATPITIDQLTVEVTGAGAGGTTARLGIYNADTDWQPISLVVDAGTVAVDANAVVTKAISVTLAAGRYLLAANTDGAPTLRSARGTCVTMLVSSLGANGLVNFLRGAQTYGAFPASGTAWTTAGGGTTPFDYFVFPRVLTP